MEWTIVPGLIYYHLGEGKNWLWHVWPNLNSGYTVRPGDDYGPVTIGFKSIDEVKAYCERVD